MHTSGNNLNLATVPEANLVGLFEISKQKKR